MLQKTSNGSAAAYRGTTLSQRLDEGFDTLAELRALVRKRQSRVESFQQSDPANDLANALYAVVGSLDRLLQVRRPSSNPDQAQSTVNVSELARAMLIAGCRYEPAILQAIREYRTCFDNVRRYSVASLPAEVKADVLARFRQQLDYCWQTLQALDVDPFVPSVGDPVIPTRHRVVKVLACHESAHPESIAEVITPGFEWLDSGDRRIEPAEVLAFGPATNAIELTEAWKPNAFKGKTSKLTGNDVRQTTNNVTGE